MIAAVPELAEGGYWYVLEPSTDPEMGEYPLPDMKAGFCAWLAEFEGKTYAVARRVDGALVPGALSVPVGKLFGGVRSKPHARLGGR